ncbi:hypothetical protein [Actinomadura macrotermitis]|uniref:Uncharacterized protein n=1 Tax=Actinomadura macrotermitis TaxID=2585200 RepID=A0A7K0C7N7_9ACTN|nr:hypothetical protein [Actinomadura macrotermitis]MQY09470.1 hypothetical protein [Actinomadura macrotermitis]
MPEEPRPLCAHCGVVVKAVDTGRPAEIVYRHDLRVEPWDHLLEPVLGTPRPLPPACDFCEAPEPDWIYPPATGPVAPHEDLPASEEAPLLHELTRHEWFACDTCSVLIADGDLDGLLDRVLGDRPALDAPTARRVRGAFGTFLAQDPHPYPNLT